MPAGIDFRRYRKVRRFVTRVFIRAVWWDVVLNVPGLRRFRRSPLVRYAEVARRYRALATEMGGVLIKLGQFLSTRVDILPPEITEELAGLQDEVPPERFADIAPQIEADFGRPLSQVFAWIAPDTLGAASLAQVHRACLPGGQEVVVKVLRPGIDVLVETDLAAARLALRLLRISKKIRRRVDLHRLGVEITETTRAELDLMAEGRNAERFARDFAGDDRVYLPKVFWDWTAGRTLTLENVGWLKIGDLAALDAAGIRRSQVARDLYRIYLCQIFEHSFVHADPHPGNLFVRPLPVGGETPFAPGDPVPSPPGGEERPFQLAFVDFGMVAVIPERLRGALREYAIGLGTRDAARLVHSYVAAGVLLPGADLRRLEEVHEELFARFWGVSIGSLRETAFSEASYFLREYRDLLYELPFQMQVDLLFASRAVGLLAGLATHLDPEFDPWAETLPFAERLAAEELRRDWRGLLREGLAQLQILLSLPRRTEAFLSRAERGSLTVQAALTPESRRMIQRLERSIHRLAWMVVSAALLIAAVMVHADTPQEPYAQGLAILAALVFLWGVLSKR
ncbi:MAG TPA: AarF/UbiB family protein [Thermoanaerobaculia bacterium]|jgi:predicted unusual protein kinase regulating ubiquinone biosynthesis (AarF/ABC1/UbiB family)